MSIFQKLWKKFTFSPLLQGKSISRKIAYLGLLTAFTVVANAFFEFKLGEIQYSLTIVVCALTGVLLGTGYGFVVCFLGDLIGFIMHPFGAYLPWIGISVGLTSLFAGWLLNMENLSKKWGRYAFCGVVCLLSFFFCTVGITHTTFFFLYAGGRSYWAYFIYRFFAQGQFYNCIFNYALLFIVISKIEKVPFVSSLLQPAKQSNDGGKTVDNE